MLIPCVGVGVVLEVGVKTVHSCSVGSGCSFADVEIEVKTVHSICVGSVCMFWSCSKGSSQNCTLVLCWFRVLILWLM